ncbi:uncharacterized protein An09g02630 [Aspergillus niger]|uniref:Contig An09c0070, genomic contig n=2 Tax=Aspergillus niger TaxID=5061 RepID=A2QTM4_ASPNC|nr:uncharacterized protein An09g02630 [Aspergillus niger]CAK40199.1 unnamed protein product [Aspergillus niger]
MSWKTTNFIGNRKWHCDMASFPTEICEMGEYVLVI